MNSHSQLVEFLQQELSIPADAIAFSLRRVRSTPNVLPIVLWQYGFVTIQQVNEIFDWLEQHIG